MIAHAGVDIKIVDGREYYDSDIPFVFLGKGRRRGETNARNGKKAVDIWGTILHWEGGSFEPSITGSLDDKARGVDGNTCWPSGRVSETQVKSLGRPQDPAVETCIPFELSLWAKGYGKSGWGYTCEAEVMAFERRAKFLGTPFKKLQDLAHRYVNTEATPTEDIEKAVKLRIPYMRPSGRKDIMCFLPEEEVGGVSSEYDKPPMFPYLEFVKWADAKLKEYYALKGIDPNDYPEFID